MKTDDFNKALSTVKMCINPSPVIPAYSLLYLNNDTIESCDGIQGIRYTVPVGVECAVRGLLFAEVVSKLSDIDPLSLQNDKLVISSGKTKIELATADKNDFVSAFDIDTYKHSIKLTNDITNAMSILMSSINRITIQEEQNGITMIIDENGISMYATNNIRASKFHIPMELDFSISILLPESFCRRLLSLNTGNGELFFGTKTVKAIFPKIEFISKLKEIELLDFEGKIFSNYDFKSIECQFVGDFPKSLVLASSILDKDRFGDFDVGNTIKFKVNTGISVFEDEINIGFSNTFKFKADIPIFLSLLKDVVEFGFVENDNGVFVIGRANPGFNTIMGTFSEQEENTNEEK